MCFGIFNCLLKLYKCRFLIKMDNIENFIILIPVLFFDKSRSSKKYLYNFLIFLGGLI